MRTAIHPQITSFARPALMLTLFVLWAAPGVAGTWWDNAWSSRKKITIDTTPTGASITDAIGTATVLVRLHDGNFTFPAANGDGSDLRFVAEDDKTPLSFQIEKYDSLLLNEAFIWVKVPEVKPGGTTTVWLYYGNAKATTAAETKAAFDTETMLAYHFGESGQPAVDATSLGNNALKAGTATERSFIGGGLVFDGRSSVTIPASPSLAWNHGAALTWSAWVKLSAWQPAAVIFSRREGDRAFVIGADQGVPYVVVTAGSGATVRGAGGPALAANTWHHLAVVAQGAEIKLLVDGEMRTTLASALPALKGLALLGADTDGFGSAGFTGEVDELRISRVSRTAGLLRLAAVTENGETAERALAITADEKPSSLLTQLESGYVGIILNSLSVDGWVVIGLLAVMAAISWLVMIGKATYLRGVGKGNGRFLEEWSHVATDLAQLDADDGNAAHALGQDSDGEGHRTMRRAPLYRIYHIGVEEIRHRVSTDKDGNKGIAAKGLSARSIQAIRASLDGGLVRETQRLNSNMVLLTIAISGGPFLGLLGTVVGVMITFAAVAAAGDVNVNAIAPGIAAALAATVAGLAVAIPSLFGYNYLLTKIKATTNDMHVFIDEFVTKMAEYYAESGEE